ncbi:MAG: prephenate dehydratase [Hahellaceae bacterium]|nr:prephenate dehydratase [Hahellaceae bacterium]
MTIAYQGHEGAYSHLSCQRVFPGHQAIACSSFREAMRIAERGEADMAMIPVENSTAGRVEEIYRLIPEMQLHIVGEHFEPVNHCLLARPGTTLTDIKTVVSHPQALAQCANHIEALHFLPQARLDTAGAALEVSQRNDHSYAAIASTLAAELYQLTILKDNFQDMSGNTTRFIILSPSPVVPKREQDKTYITSVLFRARNIPAALYKALGGFATNGVNLCKVESYISGGGMNSSQFHVDIEGHIHQRPLQRALEELSFFAEETRLLGTYPAHPFRANCAFRD